MQEGIMGDLAMIIKTRTRPGKRAEVQQVYQELLVPRALENDAQELIVWCDDQHDPDVFVLFEVYRDGAALGVNAQSEWFARYMARVGPLLAGEPEVTMATPGWSKGL
jgi:quinol monooxygenase YgiN